MPNFIELGSEIVGDVLGGASGPLGDLFNSKHGYDSFSFPSDVEGVGQRHFIRFNITTIEGASFDVAGKNTEQANESGIGEFIGGLVGGAISDAIPGGVGSLAGGIGASVATNIADQILASDAIGAATDFAGDIISGAGDIIGEVAESVESTFGRLTQAAESVKNAIVEKVPIAEDALNGIGAFAGSIGGVAESFSSGTGGTKKSEADIILYMPFSINENYQANWAGGEMGLVGAMLKAGTSAAAGNWDTLNEQLTLSNLKGAASEIGGKIAGAAIGNENIEKKLLKNQGKAINPYWELFFEGVTPRTFTFDFKMSPKNATEAAAIQNIIRTFKTYAAPPANAQDTEGSASLRYWGYPSFFEIEYWNSEILHKIKPCALQNIVVNYAGDGTNHTFYDGYPIQTDLTLTFMESELLTRQDFSKRGF